MEWCHKSGFVVFFSQLPALALPCLPGLLTRRTRCWFVLSNYVIVVFNMHSVTKRQHCFLQVLLVYGLAFMVILPVVVVSFI